MVRFFFFPCPFFASLAGCHIFASISVIDILFCVYALFVVMATKIAHSPRENLSVEDVAEAVMQAKTALDSEQHPMNRGLLFLTIFIHLFLIIFYQNDI